MRKNILQEHQSCSVQKTARKNTKYSRNEIILKIGHFAKAKAHAKAIAFANCQPGSKFKNSKNMQKNHSTRTVDLFCAKDGARKRQLFGKKDHFEIRPLCKNYSPCKDYSLCKRVSLGQKLKMRKTCEETFYKNTRVVLCKKRLGKNTKYSRNETILKIGHFQRLQPMHRLQPLQNGQFGSKIKNTKKMRKTIL